MRSSAEDASGRKARLLNAVSHDIRNPVNTISLMADVLRRTAEDPGLVTHVVTNAVKSTTKGSVTLSAADTVGAGLIRIGHPAA